MILHPFNSISVIGRWEFGNERLFAMELCLWLKIFPPTSSIKPRPLLDLSKFYYLVHLDEGKN